MNQEKSFDREVRRITREILAAGDGLAHNQELCVSEIQLFLKDSPYQPFVEWLLGKNRGDTFKPGEKLNWVRGRMGDFDTDGNKGSLSKRELRCAVAAYLCEYLERRGRRRQREIEQAMAAR